MKQKAAVVDLTMFDEEEEDIIFVQTRHNLNILLRSLDIPPLTKVNALCY
jgi:hypothetical protein